MVALLVLVHLPLIALSFLTLSRASPLGILSRSHSNHRTLAIALNAMTAIPAKQSSMAPPISSSAATTTTTQMSTGASSSSATMTTTAQMSPGTSSPATSSTTTTQLSIGTSSPSATTTTTTQIPTGTSSSTTPKYVVAHFMVGNVYSFTVDNWLADIILAHSSGIDGFALNVGIDDWQPQQVANAYVPNLTQ